MSVSVLPASKPSVIVRLATPHDEDAQERFWTKLSPESNYSRFFTGNPNAFRTLTTDPALRTVMLAALDAGTVVGVGDLLTHADGLTAEVAFAVLDGHQGQGIGQRLLTALTHLARARGIARFTATVLRFNRPMLGVFHRSGLVSEQRHRFDACELTLDLSVSRAA